MKMLDDSQEQYIY